MSDAAVRSGSRAAYALTVGMLVASVSLFTGPIRDLSPLHREVALHPVVLALLTLVLASSSITLQFRRQGHTLSMSEIPLAVGLFAMSPVALVLAKMAGHAMDGMRRRLPAYKTVFNVSLVAFQVPLALLLFRFALDGAAPHGPRAWFAAGCAVLLANVISAVTIMAVIGLMQTRVERTALDLEVGTWLVVSLVETSLAMLTVEVLRAEPRTAWLLVVLICLLVFFSRAYSSLRERNDELAFVYAFGRSLASPGDTELRAFIAGQVRDLLRAERVDLVLDTGSGIKAWSAGDEGVTVAAYDPQQWPWTDVAESGAPVLGGAGRDVVAVPLRGERGVMGMLAAYDRMGTVRRFGPVDLHLLEALAAPAGATVESARLVERLRFEAAHDTLTGLPNWTGLRADVDDAIAAGRPVALILMDLDRFKDVNDTLGHHNGDLLLSELGSRLTEHCGNARAVVLYDGSDAAAATRFARELLDVVRAAVVLDGVRIEMAASIGITLYPEHGLDAASLLQRADVAMYAAKSAHAGVAVYQPTEDHVSARRLVLAGELRRALDEGTLTVAYQPKVSLDDGRAIGVEALLRWQHRELGFITPDEFVPLAERTGLIVPLTSYVLDRALAQCAEWQRAGVDIGVAVNISVRNLLGPDLPDELGGLLVRHGVEPRRLTLEITESSVMEDPTRALDVLDRLSRIGIRLSVDDFGTGYSSLTYLKRLPVNEVKIDKSFVMSMATDEGDAAIVRSIIDLAGSLGLTVVAEGVEDATSWERLVEYGCDIAQGYAISRPVPATDATEWLRGWDPNRAARRSAREVTPLAPRRRARGRDS